jgi:hypothetical protein
MPLSIGGAYAVYFWARAGVKEQLPMVSVEAKNP